MTVAYLASLKELGRPRIAPTGVTSFFRTATDGSGVRSRLLWIAFIDEACPGSVVLVDLDNFRLSWRLPLLGVLGRGLMSIGAVRLFRGIMYLDDDPPELSFVDPTIQNSLSVQH